MTDHLPGNEETIFNRIALLERLEDESLCDQLIDIFVKEFPRQLTQLQKALVEEDAGTAERWAHTIKGGAANIEARRLCRAAYDVEVAGRERDLAKAKRLSLLIDEEFRRLIEVLGI